MPATFTGRAYGYVDRETLEWLGGAPGYNQLYLLADNRTDAASVRQVADQVRSHMERAGVRVVRVDVARPGELPLQNYFQAIIVVLGSLGVLALFLSVLLVTNTIAALLIQQTRQIGVMKAIGARPRQIVFIYAMYALVFGVLALPLALPASRAVTKAFVDFLAYFLNFKTGTFTTPAAVIGLQIGMALLTPVLAALAPVIHAARLTVREAIAGWSAERTSQGRPCLIKREQAICATCGFPLHGASPLTHHPCTAQFTPTTCTACAHDHNPHAGDGDCHFGAECAALTLRDP
jgi:putative ABC transport system permease protein